MWITDKDDNLMERIQTSFELAYMSLCGFEVKTNDLRNLFSSTVPGWVHFFTEFENKVDIDNTSLVYLALLQKNIISPDYVFAFTQDAILNLRDEHGLIKNSYFDGSDAVANFHFLVLLHSLDMRNEKIEQALELWLQSELTTIQYHNPKFILYTLNKLMPLLKDCIFKEKLQLFLSQKSKPLFQELQCKNGIFKDRKIDVYFHLLEPPSSGYIVI